jgi:hypothetical protein
VKSYDLSKENNLTNETPRRNGTVSENGGCTLYLHGKNGGITAQKQKRWEKFF